MLLIVYESSVKLNIMINRTGLLIINIYINDVCRRMAGVAVHSGEMSAFRRLAYRNANKRHVHFPSRWQ
jgi:hypothetical protein